MSPTGVRGLMMLTRDTASAVRVFDRLDPEKSIDGGTKYLAYLKKQVPNRIQEPDRKALSLAEAIRLDEGFFDGEGWNTCST